MACQEDLSPGRGYSGGWLGVAFPGEGDIGGGKPLSQMVIPHGSLQGLRCCCRGESRAGRGRGVWQRG